MPGVVHSYTRETDEVHTFDCVAYDSGCVVEISCELR